MSGLEDRAKRRARLFTVLGIVLALGAAGLTYVVASQGQQQAAPVEEKVDVVVAVRDLQARQVIAASDVTVAKYPITVAPPGAAKDPKEVIGRILVAPVSRNEPITSIRWTVPQGQAAFSVLPPGEELKPDSPNYRVISITVSDSNAVGGNIQPGDTVDLIATLNLDPNAKFNPPPAANATPDPKFVTDFQTKTIFESLPILAKAGGVYTIRISDLQTAQKLYYLQAAGAQLAMALRAGKDDRVVATQGTSFPSIYQDFGFKVVTRVDK